MLKAICGMMAVIMLAGCATTRSPRSTVDNTGEGNDPAGVMPVEAGAMEVGTDWTGMPVLETALFDTNRAELTDVARAALRRNAALLRSLSKSVPGLAVRVEGHCDERNTLEYNLALGERRALAVKSYYSALGIKKSILSTVSYGEERPVCGTPDEDCWALNRRAVTTVKAASPTRVPKNP